MLKKYYYELDNNNRIVWIDELDRLNGLNSDIVSPVIELESIENIIVWHDKLVDGKIIHHIFENQNVQLSLTEELEEIQKWFLSTDWIPNKIVREEWTKEDPRWIEYLQESIEKRNRQDQIILLLAE